MTARRPALPSKPVSRTVQRAAADDSVWRGASVVVPLRKQAISLRVDEDVLAWFRDHGPRYQSRMNAVLRSYMDALAPAQRRGRGR